MKLKIENKAPNWRRASVAPTLIKFKVLKMYAKEIRAGNIIDIKISPKLNEILWTKGPKNLGKYIEINIDITEKVLNILPGNAV